MDHPKHISPLAKPRRDSTIKRHCNRNPRPIYSDNSYNEKFQYLINNIVRHCAFAHLYQFQCDVGIWADLTGEEYYGELYFSSTDVRPTKTAMDGYQRIRTVGKGEREIVALLGIYTVRFSCFVHFLRDKGHAPRWHIDDDNYYQYLVAPRLRPYEIRLNCKTRQLCEYILLLCSKRFVSVNCECPLPP